MITWQQGIVRFLTSLATALLATYCGGQQLRSVLGLPFPGLMGLAVLVACLVDDNVGKLTRERRPSE